MKKQLMILATILAMVGVSFAQSGGGGIRATGGLVWTGGDFDVDEIDGGFAIGGGIFTLHELSDVAAFNLGLNVLYKKIFSISQKICEDSYCPELEVGAKELSLEFPVLLRILPIEQFFIELGPQLNIALSPKFTVSIDGTSVSVDFTDRIIDIGITAGVGFNITEQISLDFHYFYGLNDGVDLTGLLEDANGGYDIEDINGPKGPIYQIMFGLNYLI